MALISAGIKTAAADPRIGQGVAVATASTGFGVMLEWIPQNAGTLAALAGFTLSVVLIILHVVRGRLELKKLALEISIIQEEADRLKQNVHNQQRITP